MRSDCPLNYGLEIFGDRWSLLIIRDLMFFGKRHYGEFLLSAEGISTNILAHRLALLKKEGILREEKDRGHKQKIIYRLTRKGIDLAPVIIEIGLWSEKYADKLNPGRDIILGTARKNRSRSIRSLQLKLQAEHERKGVIKQKRKA